MFVRALIFAVVLGAFVAVERFLLPPARQPLAWDYWVALFLFAYVLHMWINDLLAMLSIGTVAEPHLATYNDTERPIPMIC